MTLDDVAAAASVSKGGLLHHFPNKQALVRGMTERNLILWAEAIEKFRTQDPDHPGSFTRALLRASLDCPGHTAQLCAAFATGVRSFPEMVELIEEQGRKQQEQLDEDGLDPVISSMVRYVADGIWCNKVWGAPNAPNHEAVIEYLLTLASGRKK